MDKEKFVGHAALAAAWLAHTRAHVRVCIQGPRCGILDQLDLYLKRGYAAARGTPQGSAPDASRAEGEAKLAELWLDNALSHVGFCPDPTCHFNEMFQEAAQRAGVGPEEYAAEMRRVQEEHVVRALSRYIAYRGRRRGLQA